jgi:hypothetical protein
VLSAPAQNYARWRRAERRWSVGEYALDYGKGKTFIHGLVITFFTDDTIRPDCVQALESRAGAF